MRRERRIRIVLLQFHFKSGHARKREMQKDESAAKTELNYSRHWAACAQQTKQASGAKPPSAFGTWLA
jgi:hypothetical protein